MIIIVVPPTRRRKRSEWIFCNISSHQEVQLIWYRYCMSDTTLRHTCCFAHMICTICMFTTCTYGCLSHARNLLNLFIIYNNSVMLLLFITYEQHGVSYLMCSQAGRACWLCAALLLYPATPLQFPHPTLCLSHAMSPQEWNRTTPTIWRGLQIADSLWKSPVSPSTETDLWTALLGPGVCICFTSCMCGMTVM